MPEAAEAGASGEWLVIDGVAHRRVVLCFVFRSSATSREVLLGLKRTGFGAGRVVAIGGKIDGDETDVEAAVREVLEESGLGLEQSGLRPVGRIAWTFPAEPTWSMVASLFTAAGDGSEPVACEEIEPRWYDVRSIPWDSMWKDAPFWLPHILTREPTGEPLQVRITMAEDNENVTDAVVTGPGS